MRFQNIYLGLCAQAERRVKLLPKTFANQTLWASGTLKSSAKLPTLRHTTWLSWLVPATAEGGGPRIDSLL